MTTQAKEKASEQAKKADSRVARALGLLAEAAQGRLRHHPQGHLVAGVREALDLALPLPLSGDAAELGAAAAEVEEALARAVEGLIHHRAAFRPGCVYCLRCGSAECEHAPVPSPRSTFAGYGPSGIPRFVDFPQWLVERRDPRAEELYRQGASGRTVAVTVPGSELTSEVLSIYEDRAADYRLHGQVTAGWYRATDEQGHEVPLAVTFQVVSSRPPGNRRRLGLNVLVRGPGGESAEHLYDRMGEIPWSSEARWAQSVLASVEQGLDRAVRKKRRGKKQAKKPGGPAPAAPAPAEPPAEAAAKVERPGAEAEPEATGAVAKPEQPEGEAPPAPETAAAPGTAAATPTPAAGPKPAAEDLARQADKELAHVEARIDGLLNGLARRLEKGVRSRERRTRHAEERHDQGDRPTRMALADLAQAKDENVFLDTRHRTFVVLGERGRAHVFNRQGKLVTSIRYSSEAIERRQGQGRWQPLPKDEVAALRVMVEGEQR